MVRTSMTVNSLIIEHLRIYLKITKQKQIMCYHIIKE